MFGHPRGNTVVATDAGPVELKQFNEIGWAVGIFQFRGLNYIEAFYSSSVGDLNGERIHDESMYGTLAVFRRKAGTLRNICEIEMSAPGTNVTAK